MSDDVSAFGRVPRDALAVGHVPRDALAVGRVASATNSAAPPSSCSSPTATSASSTTPASSSDLILDATRDYKPLGCAPAHNDNDRTQIEGSVVRDVLRHHMVRSEGIEPPTF